jgi:serine/threonine protein kinase
MEGNRTTMAEQQELLGWQVDGYRLLQMLGKGCFGTVYLAEHLYDHSQAAVKVLHFQLTSQEDFKAFLNEARTIRLRHEHIVPLLDFALSRDNTPYLVMEYIAGGTLRQHYPRGMKLSPETIDRYAGQLASALQHAHDRRVIHRDVKPDNILLRTDGTLLLSDFGTAKVLEQSSFVNSQIQVGTPAYMAPEQSQGKPCLASDQYALAVIVYEWLTGRLPFQGTPLEIMMQHRVDAPLSLQALCPEVPIQVEQVVLQALAKKPEERFSTVEEFAQALHTTLQTFTSTQQETRPNDWLSSIEPFTVSSHAPEALSISSRSTIINDQAVSSALSDTSLPQKLCPSDTAVPPMLHFASSHSPEKSPASSDQVQTLLLPQLASSAQTQAIADKEQENHSLQPLALKAHLPTIQSLWDSSPKENILPANAMPAEAIIPRFSNKRFVGYKLLGTLLCLTLLMGLVWASASAFFPSYVTKHHLQLLPVPKVWNTPSMSKTSLVPTISVTLPARTNDTDFTPVTPSSSIAPTPGASITATATVPKPKPTPTPTPKPTCPPTQEYGSTGSWVKVLQQELSARGMKDQDGKTLVVDGEFGPRTRYAVESWQKHASIQVDGIVGPITWHTLGKC